MLKLANLCKVLLISFLPLFSSGQYDSSRTFSQLLGDTLSFRILKVHIDSSISKEKVVNTRSSVMPNLRYDFRSQYPWYQAGNSNWKLGESYQLEFSKLPLKGWIYLYSVDGANDVREHGIIHLDSLKYSTLVYPDSLKSFTFTAEGADQLVLWYSRDSISQASKLIKGIELTMGDFVKRNNRQLDKALVLPLYGWQMLEKNFGFVTNPELFKFKETSILPIIIRFDVVPSKPKLKQGPSK